MILYGKKEIGWISTILSREMLGLVDGNFCYASYIIIPK